MLKKFPKINNQINAYKGICEQFFTDAAFLWLLRSNAVNQPHYNQADLKELEIRIDANLDGLMNSFELAWDIALKELEYEQAGECFAATIVAFRSRDMVKIKHIVNHGFINEETFDGLVSALAWLPKYLVNDWLQKFLYSKDLNHKHLAITLCSLQRKKPGDMMQELLSREDCIAHTALLSRTLRLIGELKLYSFSNTVKQWLNHENESVSFWANWTLLLLGETKFINNLFTVINEGSQYQHQSIQIAFKILPVEQARLWISTLAQNPAHIRAVIKASGVLGDPHAIPWLIDKMKVIDTAKIAAEAFEMITGLDLVRYQLSLDTPADITVVPNDDESDDNVELDDDEHLPFPNVSKISHMWLTHRAKYKSGSRYLLGTEVVQDSSVVSAKLDQYITQGRQRQRHSAALSLAIIDPQSPLYNTKARNVQ